MRLLLDTHAALWLVQGNDRLGETARTVIEPLGRDERCISDLLLFELSLLVSKKRIEIDEPLSEFLQAFSTHFHVLPVDAHIAALAVEIALPQADPFDRIFVASALRHKLPLVTRDRQIRDATLVNTIW